MVNFPGSIGFGKSYCRAGNGEWGNGKILASIKLVMEDLKSQGLMDERVIAAGYSFGAHIVYAALAYHPDLFMAGIAGAGYCDLAQSIRNEKTQDDKQYWKTLMGGDPETVEGRNYLRERSPLFNVEHISKPLLIISPEEDEIVPHKQTVLMAEALEKHRKIVTQIKIEKEGHNIQKPENILAAVAVIEQFLGQLFDINVEPIGGVLRDAPNFKVIRGANNIPELKYQLYVDEQVKKSSYASISIPRHLTLPLITQQNPEILYQVINRIIRTVPGRQLIESLFDAALYEQLVTNLIWLKNMDGHTFRPTNITLKKGVNLQHFIEFAFNYMVSRPEYCAQVVAACQDLLLPGLMEANQDTLVSLHQRPSIRVEAASLLNQFQFHRDKYQLQLVQNGEEFKSNVKIRHALLNT